MKKNILRSMKRSILLSLTVLAIVVLIGIFQGCSNDDPTYGTPAIKEFTFASGAPVGSVVIITGSFFSITPEKNIVKFNGVDAGTPKKASASSLTVIVPEGATTGKITVTVGDHTGTSANNFTVTSGKPAPYIMDFTPTTGSGANDVTVTINGFNFSTTAADNVVKFNGVAASTPSSASANSLSVVVPAGTTTGKITVDVTGVTGTATSDVDFSAPAPTVDSFTPTFSIVGSTVVITGTNFSKTADNNTVKFNGVTTDTPVSVNVDDPKANKLTVTVPAGATTGKISVTVDGQTATSKGDFEVKI